GYRKYGHNEGDEPRFTQPGLYKLIAKDRHLRDWYAEKLLSEGVIDANLVKTSEKEYKDDLDQNLEAYRKKDLTIITPFMQNEWNGFKQVSNDIMLQKVNTTVEKSTLDSIIETVSTLPSDKKFINKITKIVTD